MIKFYTKVGKRVLGVIPEFFYFPGGELHLKADPDTFVGQEIAYISGKANFEDYFMLNLWNQVVRSQGGTAHIFVPYLPAARADRGIPLGLAPYRDLLVGAADGTEIHVLDAHSSLAVKHCEDRGASVTNHRITDFPDLVKKVFSKYDGIIAPDRGAEGRSTAFAKILEVPVFQASKTRDFDSGAITGFEVPDLEIPNGKYLLVDDICDGGGTFIGLAQALARKYYPSKADLDLFVTHGIFSNGLEPLEAPFRTIYTTNTFPQDVTLRTRPRLTEIDIKTTLIQEVVK